MQPGGAIRNLLTCQKRQGRSADPFLLTNGFFEMSHGSIALDESDGKVAPMTGKGKKSEPKRDKLSVIVDDINKQFGTNFTEMDKVLKQIENDLINDPELQKFAKSDRETIRIVYDKLFPSILANRYATNEDFFSKMCSDKKFMSDVMARLFPIVLQRLVK